ncbi:hypothetical protein SLEP1_g51352 [Rubroshorea leprosula]|uniref:Uncharacterized protein n=1 Tax=Rubroshorea leprosula TaxID=152421 RepID=A0AAV5M2W7_9ROSI|nr:hypothetical protein SLEP1_g51352 [Rubroshorea leprosula]
MRLSEPQNPLVEATPAPTVRDVTPKIRTSSTKLWDSSLPSPRHPSRPPHCTTKRKKGIGVKGPEE